MLLVGDNIGIDVGGVCARGKTTRLRHGWCEAELMERDTLCPALWQERTISRLILLVLTSPLASSGCILVSFKRGEGGGLCEYLQSHGGWLSLIVKWMKLGVTSVSADCNQISHLLSKSSCCCPDPSSPTRDLVSCGNE